MKSLIYKGYTVFEDGQVVGLKGTILKPGITSVGYKSIVICADGKHTTELIHRLVAKCFIPNPENKRTVNHKDGNKLNNHVSNLEWATDKENINHAFETGLNKKAGESLRQRMQKTVIDISNGKIYASAIKASKATGINPNTLRAWLIGKRQNKSSLQYLK